MATTQLDKFMIAWLNLQKAVNKTIPNTTNQVWAARNRMISGSGGGGAPKPS